MFDSTPCFPVHTCASGTHRAMWSDFVRDGLLGTHASVSNDAMCVTLIWILWDGGSCMGMTSDEDGMVTHVFTVSLDITVIFDMMWKHDVSGLTFTRSDVSAVWRFRGLTFSWSDASTV